MSHFFSAAIAAALLVASLGCGGSGGGSTPQATFDSFKSSMQAKDYQKGFSQITPESQDIMIALLTVPLGMMAEFDQEKGAEAQKILKKHGIKAPGGKAALTPSSDPKAGMTETELAAGVKDKPACIAEIIIWLEKSGIDKDNAILMPDMGAAELIDVKIDGDTASGKIKTKKRDAESTEPAEFKKVDGVWLIDFSKTIGGIGGPPVP